MPSVRKRAADGSCGGSACLWRTMCSGVGGVGGGGEGGLSPANQLPNRPSAQQKGKGTWARLSSSRSEQPIGLPATLPATQSPASYPMVHQLPYHLLIATSLPCQLLMPPARQQRAVQPQAGAPSPQPPSPLNPGTSMDPDFRGHAVDGQPQQQEGTSSQFVEAFQGRGNRTGDKNSRRYRRACDPQEAATIPDGPYSPHSTRIELGIRGLLSPVKSQVNLFGNDDQTQGQANDNALGLRPTTQTQADDNADFRPTTQTLANDGALGDDAEAVPEATAQGITLGDEEQTQDQANDFALRDEAEG
eukprot:gene27177-2416_t